VDVALVVLMRQAVLGLLLLAACSKQRRAAQHHDAGPLHVQPARGDSLAALAYLPAEAPVALAVDFRALRTAPLRGSVEAALGRTRLYGIIRSECHIDPIADLDWAAAMLTPGAPKDGPMQPIMMLHGRLDEAGVMTCLLGPDYADARAEVKGGALYGDRADRAKGYAFVKPDLLVHARREWLEALLAGGAATAEHGELADLLSQMDTSKTAWIVSRVVPTPRRDRPTWYRVMVDLSAGLHLGAVLGFESPVDANEITRKSREAAHKLIDPAKYPHVVDFQPVGERVYITVDLTPEQARELWPVVAAWVSVFAG
jgi:hypothetical protein